MYKYPVAVLGLTLVNYVIRKVYIKDKVWILICIYTCTMIQTQLCELSKLTKARARNNWLQAGS